ncbi:MAG: ubiquinol-cytochrome c reductase iron-sulfur subunit [Candidatus Marinimicrobia bacterium]|nr:ubiquinol-cytochrome c reductase iron-sulfur subunit [Candidatus Neomarinimicrobiota bacterium]MCF7829541.1 ubiquinol-cytochrome c reductase iron-sulfur subunit [Candidatus Neomarinimicrobiota bacterium]MCF7880061.1 ubiquinol-cytochrome c reductase iron-sulfur subunit [Candidatus Neomarinimicrobiota bacterium]
MSEKQINSTVSKGDSRRSFLKKVAGVFLLGGLFSQGWFALRSMNSPGIQRAVNRYKLGKPEDFQDGFTFIEHAKVFVEKQGDEYAALSAVCTHLGCTLKKENEGTSQYFQCPCHRSKFNADGKNIAGPANKPLQYLELLISPDDGQLMVDLSSPIGNRKALVV